MNINLRANNFRGSAAYLFAAFLLASLLLTPSNFVHAQDAQATFTPSLTPTAHAMVTPSDLIEAVNTGRINSGLNALSVHPVLMQVAQTEANGIANGMPGHWRPNNMSLGQWLLSLGYPLSGDLSLDGYRSENWLFLSATATKEEIIYMWRGDPEHANTMESDHRSDIGAGIAVTADGELVAVIETALQTASGKMQYDASKILTGIPQTQQAYSAMGTEAALNGTLPQYLLPVAVNTALPNGDIIHEVKYGQTLWSIAVKYGVTIKQIQQLNSLSNEVIYVGQKLIVARGATQPAPTRIDSTPATPLPAAYVSPTPLISPMPTLLRQLEFSEMDKQKNVFAIILILAAALFLGALFAVMTHKKDE